MIKAYTRSVTYFLIMNISGMNLGFILSGDIENYFSSEGLTICHWNLNSLSSHMYKKVSLLSDFSVYKLGIICLSETYLHSETSPDDDNLEIPGYNIIRKDHPSNTKRGGICVYYKNTLPFKIINIKCLQECITFEIRIERKC